MNLQSYQEHKIYKCNVNMRFGYIDIVPLPVYVQTIYILSGNKQLFGTYIS